MKAVISDCGLYRYRLEREIQAAGQVFAYFGVNPSTADAELEDQTTKKWRGFTVRNGGRRYLVGNPFGFRATDVKHLAGQSDPVGPLNRVHLQGIIRDADVLIPCWGNRSKVPRSLHHHVAWLKAHILEAGKPVKVFGLTASGDPKHPLMLGYDTPLTDWRGA